MLARRCLSTQVTIRKTLVAPSLSPIMQRSGQMEWHVKQGDFVTEGAAIGLWTADAGRGSQDHRKTTATASASGFIAEVLTSSQRG